MLLLPPARPRRPTTPLRSISPDENDFAPILLSEVLPRKALEEMAALNRASVLVRQPALDILSAMRDSSGFQRILLHGPARCGKSITLLHAVHYARDAGWAILHVPSGFNVTRVELDHELDKKDMKSLDQVRGPRRGSPVHGAVTTCVL